MGDASLEGGGVLAEANVGIGPGPETPDIDGELRCRRMVGSMSKSPSTTAATVSSCCDACPSRPLTRHRPNEQTTTVSAQEIDDYLSRLDSTKRHTLEQLRRMIVDLVPEAEQGISYGVPAFRMDGRVVAGFSAAEHHLSYLPHSGTLLSELDEDVAGYARSKGALRFAVDTPLPREVVEKLISARRIEIQQLG